MSLIIIINFDFHELYKILVICIYLELIKWFLEIISNNKIIDNNQYFLIINFIIEFYSYKFSTEKSIKIQNSIIIILRDYIIINKVKDIYFQDRKISEIKMI